MQAKNHTHNFLCPLEKKKFKARNTLLHINFIIEKQNDQFPCTGQKGIFSLTPIHHKVQECDFATY